MDFGALKKMLNKNILVVHESPLVSFGSALHGDCERSHLGNQSDSPAHTEATHVWETGNFGFLPFKQSCKCCL